jgi:thiol:disulfide interchange protein
MNFRYDRREIKEGEHVKKALYSFFFVFVLSVSSVFALSRTLVLKEESFADNSISRVYTDSNAKESVFLTIEIPEEYLAQVKQSPEPIEEAKKVLTKYYVDNDMKAELKQLNNQALIDHLGKVSIIDSLKETFTYQKQVAYNYAKGTPITLEKPVSNVVTGEVIEEGEATDTSNTQAIADGSVAVNVLDNASEISTVDESEKNMLAMQKAEDEKLAKEEANKKQKEEEKQEQADKKEQRQKAFQILLGLIGIAAIGGVTYYVTRKMR